MSRTRVLTDEMWAQIEPLRPDRTPQRGGRWIEHRPVLEAICSAGGSAPGRRGGTSRPVSLRGRRFGTASTCGPRTAPGTGSWPVSYTHLRAHETDSYL